MLIHINLYLKIVKLAIIIIVVSYFVGITFFIYSDIVEHICVMNDVEYDHFLTSQLHAYLPDGLQGETAYHRTMTMVYYSFTSLSTVGFGDLAPVNPWE